ncbi:MAG: alpha/beta fold hydrolase [Actinomycetes bacterium]
MGGRVTTWVFTVALLAAGVLASGAVIEGAQAGPAVTTKEVGSLTVKSCDEVATPGSLTWCGTLKRPWDPRDDSLGSFELAFALVLPVTGQLLKPAVVGIEGGPGYGSIASGQLYAEMLQPLLSDRALLVVDQRGTGRSSPVACDPDASVSACAKSLGDRFDLYGTELVAEDLGALLSGLNLGAVDVYGDSYGTFVAQVFASHHPELVHSLVLDGAYPVTGESAWYPTQGAALRNAYTVVCERANGCGRGSTETIALLNRVLAKVRAKPISVVAPGADNRMHRVRISPSTLTGVAFGGTYGPTTYREFNAVLLASLGGDHLPLGRLVAEFMYQGDEGPVSVYSPGLNIAVSCHDYPQLFDISKTEDVRKVQYAAAVSAQKKIDPSLYSPFKIREYLDSDTGEQSLCLSWPTAARNPWKLPGPPGGTYPDIPTLVLSGELDTITTVAEGELVAAQFARSRHVTFANSTHVNAMGDVYKCASQLVRDFFTDQSVVIAGTGGECARDIPPIAAVISYPVRISKVGHGVVQTALDAIDRYLQAAGYQGLGLRGGSWSASGWGPVVIKLHGYRLFQNLAVTGRVRVDFDTGAVEVRAKALGRTFGGNWNSYRVGAGANVQELR